MADQAASRPMSVDMIRSTECDNTATGSSGGDDGYCMFVQPGTDAGPGPSGLLAQSSAASAPLAAPTQILKSLMFLVSDLGRSQHQQVSQCEL